MCSKTPAVRPVEHDSDSDEAPEVVTKQSAKEQVLTLQRQEEEARAQAKAATKRKRKAKQEPKKEEEASNEVPELSDDILSAVAARNEEEDDAEEEEAEAELRARKRRAVKEAKMAEMMEKKTHTRQFGNIQVQTVEALKNTQARELTESAKKFLELRSAPTRARMNLLQGHSTQFTKKQKKRMQRAALFQYKFLALARSSSAMVNVSLKTICVPTLDSLNMGQ
ncbi:hypothetical protein P3T76_006401 [Phytophthora citrophthora]|uniref:Uncharacterized protein n=1 Tax=Phytophthora citrophthora TaxID=4793 RepID=A0AAD9GPA5_9STRA|nr:hypothetical protein P3T76_006401 [Phytophthora citrophthora]